MTATGDVLKGVLAVCIGRWLFHTAARRYRRFAVSGVSIWPLSLQCWAICPRCTSASRAARACWWRPAAILAVQPVLIPFLAVIFLACLLPTGMVSLGSIAMAALYPVLTIIYGSLQGYAAGDMLVCAIGSGLCPAW